MTNLPLADDRPIPVIFNPVAGGGRASKRRARLERAAERSAVKLDFWPTARAGHAADLSAQAALQRRPLVLAFGGDGTYNEVARGLLGSATAMGILPTGTTSVLAYEFNIPRPVDRALLSLVNGVDRKVQVGRTDRGDIFLIMLSAGPDTLVLQRLFPALKWLGGRVGVAAQAVIELFRPGAFPRLELSQGEERMPGGWVIIGKARCYAGPFQATPGADPFSRILQAVVQSGRGRRAAVSFAYDLARGRHLGRADVVMVTGGAFRLAAINEDRLIAYQVDGDIAGVLPVEVDLHPEPLVVRLPAEN